MNFKLCFDQQIRLCPQVPKDYESLLAVVKQTFNDALPRNFGLRYIDQDGDLVLVASDEDFQLMVDVFTQLGVKSIKVFVFEQAGEEKASKEVVRENYQLLPDEHEQNLQADEDKKVRYPDFLEEKKLEEPKPEVNQNELANEQRIQPEAVVNDNANDRIDLSDKKALKAFIVQTIEEALPQILANALKHNVEHQKKSIEQNTVVKGIKNVATDITSKIEKIIIGEREGLSAKVSRTERIVPDTVYTTDEQIMVTVVVKNNGTMAFPQNTFLQSVGGLQGNTVMLPPLESRKEFAVTLMLRNPKKAGNYISKWRFGWVNGQEPGKFFGEEYEVKVNVIEKKYSKDVQQKASQLKEFIPQFEISTFLEFVSKNPKLPLEVLMELFITQNNI